MLHLLLLVLLLLLKLLLLLLWRLLLLSLPIRLLLSLLSNHLELTHLDLLLKARLDIESHGHRIVTHQRHEGHCIADVEFLYALPSQSDITLKPLKNVRAIYVSNASLEIYRLDHASDPWLGDNARR